MAHQGFAKLLILRPELVNNKKKILFRILCSYFAEEHKDSNDNLIKIDLNLKSCLCTFLDIFYRLNYGNKQELSSLAIPLLELAFDVHYAFNLKKIANFFYYITRNELSMERLSIINFIIDRVIQNFNDFYKMQRWIEILLEFNIHQSNLDSSESKNICKEILTKMEKILVILV